MLSTIPEFLNRGGPALWAIALLSIVMLTLILWKIWSLARMGTWQTQRADRALAMWRAGQPSVAMSELSMGLSVRPQVLRAAMQARLELPDDVAREETARQARAALTEARSGLRTLDLIVTIAPLIGLLGTVLGMIEAFQAMQDTGNRTDAAALAGGIWVALLTTAAGMGVALPASVALSFFDGIADRLSDDLEDLAVRLFATPIPTVNMDIGVSAPSGPYPGGPAPEAA